MDWSSVKSCCTQSVQSVLPSTRMTLFRAPYRRPVVLYRSSTFDRALRELAKHARAPTTHDPTRYGLTPSSPPNIHRRTTTAPRAAISPDPSPLCAIGVLADATTRSFSPPLSRVTILCTCVV